ncbi:MAG: GNAT family N-acetyltransferase [Actinomycetota bacterium]
MQLADILAESFHSRKGVKGWVYPVLRLGIYEDLRNRFRSASDDYVCLVAQEVSNQQRTGGHSPAQEEILAGTVEMALRDRHPWPLPDSQYPYLSNLAVHPDYRRRGVAQQLLSRCEQKALQWGFSDLYLHVLENNHAARRLYHKAGYRLEQVDGHWSAWLLGKPRRLLLRKCLKPMVNDRGEIGEWGNG